MAGLAREAYGPTGDPTRHLSLRALREQWEKLPQSETETGRLRFIARRLANGQREPLSEARLLVEAGLEGDGWSRRPPRDPEAQLAVMAHPVAALIAKLILFPTGPLETVPTVARVGATAIAFVAFLLAGKRLAVGILAAELLLIGAWFSLR